MMVGFQETTTEITEYSSSLLHSQLKFAPYNIDLESLIGVQIHETGTS